MGGAFHHRGEQHLFLSPQRCIIHHLLGMSANAGQGNLTGDAKSPAAARLCLLPNALDSLTILNLLQ